VIIGNVKEELQEEQKVQEHFPVRFTLEMKNA
jgi:hypothetical protein